MAGTKNILFLGTSEVGMLENMKEQMRQIYNVNLFIACHPGATLLDLGQYLTNFLKSNEPLDQIYIFALTCSIWKKMSLTTEDQSIKVITWNPTCNLSFVPVQMDAISRIAARRNPAVKVYLVIPTMKDIATFNETFLHRKGRSDLIPLLEQQPQFQRSFLNIKAREVFGKTVELQNTNLTWFKKQTFSMKTVFDRYYNGKNQANPHHKFWMGASDKLDALDLCYDGLHYTKTAFMEMFAMLSLSNFQRRTQDPRPDIPTTSTTTTSVIVEEMEAVPGPSGIQGRIEYRPHPPRTIPSTPTKQAPKKSSTRVFYSRTFKGSTGLKERLSTPSKSFGKRSSIPDCPQSTSATKKSRVTTPTTPTTSKAKPKLKGLARFNKRKQAKRQNPVSEEPPRMPKVNQPQPSTSSTVSAELTTFTTVQVTKLWKFAKERNISKEIVLKELNRVFEQVTDMDRLD